MAYKNANKQDTCEEIQICLNCQNKSCEPFKEGCGLRIAREAGNALPRGKYKIIYADPPWQYRQSGTGPKSQGNAAQHYKTMSTCDICNLQVRDMRYNDSALFLWVTMPMLGDALSVMSAWGFDYKTAAFVWVKKNRKNGGNFLGMGAYTRANTEICLLGVAPGFRARKQVLRRDVHQIIEAPVERHSKKPDETRDRIVQLLGNVPRIELFARDRAEGWDAWGDEI